MYLPDRNGRCVMPEPGSNFGVVPLVTIGRPSSSQCCPPSNRSTDVRKRPNQFFANRLILRGVRGMAPYAGEGSRQNQFQQTDCSSVSPMGPSVESTHSNKSHRNRRIGVRIIFGNASARHIPVLTYLNGSRTTLWLFYNPVEGPRGLTESSSSLVIADINC